MGNFDPENKPKYEDVAPSLQRLIDSKASQTDLDSLKTIVNNVTQTVSTQLGSVRISVGPTAPPSPKEDKEFWWNTLNNLPCRYAGGAWVYTNAVYK